MPPSFAPTTSNDSFADLLSTIILKVGGKLADGSSYWAYMAMKPSMARPFKEAQAKGNFDLEEFGTILEWGTGQEPPAEIVEQMRRDYGADPDYQEKLLERLSQLD